MNVDEEPRAVTQCCSCGWWWFFYDRTPTEPFTCTNCKEGMPPWEEIPRRRPTPEYGKIPAVRVKGPGKKRES